MAGLPPLPVVPVMPEMPGGSAPLEDSAGTPSADFPNIFDERGNRALDALKTPELQPNQSADLPMWQDERDIPPTPPRQDPDYNLGWEGKASLPVSPQGGGTSKGIVPPDELRATISRAAGESGISPAYALAVAERESSFNPSAGGTGTIRGLFQMSGALRRQYGIPEDADPDTQAQGFARFTRDLRGQMAGIMGRAPTDAETYLGHYFGGPRAARMLAGAIDPNTPVADVFTPRELAGNPNIARAGTVGNLTRSIGADMNRRLARFGQPQDADFAAFGRGEDGDVDLKVNQRPGTEVDLSQYGI